MELKEAIKELKSFFKDKDAIYWIGKNGIKATQIVLQALEDGRYGMECDKYDWIKLLNVLKGDQL